MTIASIFSGAMGLDIGMNQAGFNTILAVENDKHAINTIKTNRPQIPIITDAFDPNLIEIIKNIHTDAIVGGPPCQSWSYAGNRKGLDDHRGLCIPRFIEIIKAIQPRLVAMENVLGLLTASINDEKGAVINSCRQSLEEMGYHTTIEIANSANFGTPQTRCRVVLLASKTKTTHLVPTHAAMQQLDLFIETPALPKWKTLKDAIGDHPNGNCAKYSPARERFFAMLKAGQDWRDLPHQEQIKAMGNAMKSSGGRTGFFRRLSWDKPCPTLTCSPLGKANAFCHPDETRPLNVAEYARIQGFPDNWVFKGPLMSQYKQIGNAVPVQLGEAIGKALLK